MKPRPNVTYNGLDIVNMPYIKGDTPLEIKSLPYLPKEGQEPKLVYFWQAFDKARNYVRGVLQPSQETIDSKVNDRTKMIINWGFFCPDNESDMLDPTGIPLFWVDSKSDTEYK